MSALRNFCIYLVKILIYIYLPISAPTLRSCEAGHLLNENVIKQDTVAKYFDGSYNWRTKKVK